LGQITSKLFYYICPKMHNIWIYSDVNCFALHMLLYKIAAFVGQI